jgi:hypothetical protein
MMLSGWSGMSLVPGVSGGWSGASAVEDVNL